MDEGFSSERWQAISVCGTQKKMSCEPWQLEEITVLVEAGVLFRRTCKRCNAQQYASARCVGSARSRNKRWLCVKHLETLLCCEASQMLVATLVSDSGQWVLVGVISCAVATLTCSIYLPAQHGVTNLGQHGKLGCAHHNMRPPHQDIFQPTCDDGRWQKAQKHKHTHHFCALLSPTRSRKAQHLANTQVRLTRHTLALHRRVHHRAQSRAKN
jgi:hypothetical protein